MEVLWASHLPAVCVQLLIDFEPQTYQQSVCNCQFILTLTLTSLCAIATWFWALHGPASVQLPIDFEEKLKVKPDDGKCLWQKTGGVGEGSPLSSVQLKNWILNICLNIVRIFVKIFLFRYLSVKYLLSSILCDKQREPRLCPASTSKIQSCSHFMYVSPVVLFLFIAFVSYFFS